MAQPEYPWYQLLDEGSELDQGDILFDCPLVLMSDVAPFPVPLPVPIRSFNSDVLILTQTCDFAQNKISRVLVCRLESAETLGKNRQSEIIKGRQPRYAMLEKSPFAERAMTHQIVDLSDVYQLPIELVRQVGAAQTPRLRLLPPYREHISQAFARFWMRIGFPQDIKLD